MPPHPFEEDPAEHRGGRGGVRGREGQGRRAVRPAGRAGVEAEPAEPEHPRPQEHERDVGGVVRLVGEVALPPAEEHRPRQGRPPGRHVDHRPAGEVLHAPLVQEPLGVPGPVGQRAIDDQAEQDHEQQVGREPDPLGERAGDQGRRDDRELELEQGEDQERDRLGQVGMRRLAHAVEHEEGERVADQPLAADVLPERQAEPDEDPEQADDPQRDHALEHRRDHVLEATIPP